MMHSRPRMSAMLAALAGFAGTGSMHILTHPEQRVSYDAPRMKMRTGGKGRPAHSRLNATSPQHKRTCHHRKRAKAQRRRARLRT